MLQKTASDVEIMERIEDNAMDRLIMVILLIVFPPLSVLFKCNGFRPPVFINFFLCFLLLFPAYFHAVWYCFVEERKDNIFPTNGHNFEKNLQLSSVAAVVNHKNVEVY